LAAVVLIAFGVIGLTAMGSPQKGARRESQAEADALFTNGALHVIKISISPQGIKSLRQEPRKFVFATLREGTTTLNLVRVRLKGAAGSFREVDDKPGLSFELGDSDGSFHGLKKFHLNNSVQDGTYLSEWTCSEIFRQAGVPAARIAHAVVELNGRRLGLYVIVESINSDFLAHYFTESHGNVYSLGPNSDVNGLEKMGGREETNGDELRSLVATARNSDREYRRTQLPQVLDLPRFLSFMAVEVLLDHWDGYTMNVKNYEVYHDPESGRIVFMPHDLDQLLRDDRAPIVPAAQGVVAQAVLRDPQTQTQYRERFREVFTQYFVPSVLNQRIDKRVAQLAPELKKYDPQLAHELTANAGDLKTRIVRRARFLDNRLRSSPPTPVADSKPPPK
jgi:spore coat protein CotH